MKVVSFLLLTSLFTLITSSSHQNCEEFSIQPLINPQASDNELAFKDIPSFEYFSCLFGASFDDLIPGYAHDINNVIDFSIKAISNIINSNKSKLAIELDHLEHQSFFSSKLSDEMILKAQAALFYGIQPDHHLFGIARAFLLYAHLNGISSYNPLIFFAEDNVNLNLSKNFDIFSPEFQEFCNYLTSTATIPITSPLYVGPQIFKTQKLSMKHQILVDLARNESVKLIEKLDVSTFVDQILLIDNGIDAFIAEEYVEIILKSIKTYLATVRANGSFNQGFESAIKVGSSDASNYLGIDKDDMINDILFNFFLDIFSSPLTLMENFNSIEVLKINCDPNFESSPAFDEFWDLIHDLNFITYEESSDKISFIEPNSQIYPSPVPITQFQDASNSCFQLDLTEDIIYGNGTLMMSPKPSYNQYLEETRPVCSAVKFSSDSGENSCFTQH